MSSKGYAKRWLAAVETLRSLIAAERDVQRLELVTDIAVAQGLISHLYARYLLLVNDLSDIYDQMLQYQRRLVIETLLEVATRRMLEWKHELCQLQMSDFVYIDQTLVQQKLVPPQAMLSRPYHFPIKRSLDVQAMIDAWRTQPEAMEEIDSGAETESLASDREPTHETLESVAVAERRQSTIDAPDEIRFDIEEGTPALYPINKTEFSSDFYAIGDDVPFEFYRNPNDVRMADDEPTEMIAAASAISMGTTDALLPPKTCRPPRIFDSTEWLLAQNTEPERSESEILREEREIAAQLAAVCTIERAWCAYKHESWRRNA